MRVRAAELVVAAQVLVADRQERPDKPEQEVVVECLWR